MPKLTSPNGALVNVSDEKAKRLLAQGFTAVEEKSPKTTAKKASPSRITKK